MLGAWCVLALTFGWLVARAGESRRLVGALGAVASIALGATELVLARLEAPRARSRQTLEAVVPQPDQTRGYVSSDSCRACHPREYASWHRSYHRTMTQLATPETVRGAFDGVRLVDDGYAYVLTRRGDELWADVEGDRPRRITMTTGSHHMQAYWVATGEGNAQREFAFTYLLEDRKWVPRRDTFLLSPSHTKGASVWNGSCIECHATAGRPRLDVPAGPESRVAEIGIACEACHGPAYAHLEVNQNPFRRAWLRWTGRHDDTIVDPERLPAKASTEICGQCHGIACKLEGWKARGVDYRPGDDLDSAKPMIRTATLERSPCRAFAEREDDFVENRFWNDGVVRVTGREHNALAESACYRGGRLSCLSCHSMHESDPDRQLAPGAEGDEPCFGCHASYRDRAAEHTHHRAGSPGSACANCHMPHTTYGLLKAIRSHRIDAPDIRNARATGRPDACSLCHLDRPLAWTAEALTRWYGARAPELDEDDRRIAAGVRWALSGDAAQRALVAWSMGWRPAQEAAGTAWLAPVLVELLHDRYAAVRYIAARSLRTLPGLEQFTYDYVGPPGARAEAAAQALATWRSRRSATPPGDAAAVLLSSSGDPLESEIDRLLSERDDPDMFLAE